MQAVEHDVSHSDSADAQTGTRTFDVVVHVCSDHAFKKFLSNCATCDLLLYRGLLLKVGTLAHGVTAAAQGRQG
jgi:hypothetical protein